MTPIERVQAARDKLIAERDASTPGAWSGYQNILGVDRIRDERGYIVAECYGAKDAGAENAELIVTLHRTIDPLLSTLERWLEYRPLAMEEPIVALADAILGTSS